MDYLIILLFNIIFIFYNIDNVSAKSMVPVLSLDANKNKKANKTLKENEGLKYLPFITLIDKGMDTSEYWRATEILSLVRNNELDIDYEKCEQSNPENNIVHFASSRTVRPICRSQVDPIVLRSSSDTECFCDKYRPILVKRNNRTYVQKQRCPSCLRKEMSRRKSSERPKNKVFNSFSRRSEMVEESDDNYQVCPQCPHFNNHTECELFRDSCKERKVLPSEYRTYCDRKYGKWRALFVPADYSQCRCCDECIFYRELDQSCIEDEYSFDTEEFLPVTTIDFRAGCNPYWGHPEQEFKALRCDKTLRRCVPVTVPHIPNETLITGRRSFRYEPVNNEDCPVSCRGYDCKMGQVSEAHCAPGGFLPDKTQCNCCGRCSVYQQLGEKCAEFKKTFSRVNGTLEIEVEEEFLEPGCDDGLVCRQGRCQDIHVVRSGAASRRKRDEGEQLANEPCKRELKYFKKKYGPEGHLHYNAPQCTPLWLYAPVQCRRFVCYCALEDGSFIVGIKVPRVEVSNMNCDCAREKCRTGSDVECDGYGNYKEAVFTAHVDEFGNWPGNDPQGTAASKMYRATTGNMLDDMLPTTRAHHRAF